MDLAVRIDWRRRRVVTAFHSVAVKDAERLRCTAPVAAAAATTNPTAAPVDLAEIP